MTAKNIDEQVFSQTTSENTATEITQLMIDIQALDDSELSQWIRKNPGKAPTEKEIDQRIRRFKNAFSLMFSHKEYKGVSNENNQKKVVFIENDKEVHIENLSSGEKQIVFRGGFFLKDAQATEDCLVLLDEPEISLHPDWQIKILPFYKAITGIDNTSLFSQMIVATHSPFILHNESRSNDKIIVLNKQKDGRVTSNDEPKFYGWTYNEVVQDAFNISLSESQLN